MLLLPCNLSSAVGDVNSDGVSFVGGVGNENVLVLQDATSGSPSLSSEEKTIFRRFLLVYLPFSTSVNTSDSDSAALNFPRAFRISSETSKSRNFP